MDVDTAYKMAPQRAVLPRAVYPSYISFDDLIDIQRLRSLDAYIAHRIRRHMRESRDDYFLNQHVPDADAPNIPGVREIWLTKTVSGTPYDYLDINRTDLWQPTPAAVEFTMVMEFVKSLPFRSIGRVLLIYDEGGRSVPAHRDHELTDVCHDFIWMRTNLRKRFYMLDQRSGRKRYVDGYSAWFDTVNQYHGSDAGDGLTFSLRVDGHFEDELKHRIPYCDQNPAATPALWAGRNGGPH